ncbi:hypothetical protein D9M69_266250 [compost metagenome]
MVGAGQLQWLHQAFGTQRLQTGVIQTQVLEAPAHLLAAQRLLAELLLGDAHGLDIEDAVDHAEVVIDGAEALGIGQVALALVHHLLRNALQHRELGAGRVRSDRDKTLGRCACRSRVFLGVAPDVADDVVGRVTHLLRGLERHGVHHAPAAQDHPVRLDPADVQPLRLLLIARVRHLQQGQLETVLVGQGLQYLVGFLAVGRAVVEGDDLLVF